MLVVGSSYYADWLIAVLVSLHGQSDIDLLSSGPRGRVYRKNQARLDGAV